MIILYLFIYSNDGYAQVIEQSYGIWHTKCFPRSNPPDQNEIQDICKQLGYLNTSKVNFRVIQSSSNILNLLTYL